MNVQNPFSKNTSEEDEGFYKIGMDLFMLLSFCFMALLLNAGTIEVSGMSAKNNSNDIQDKSLLIFLDDATNAVRIGSVTAPLTEIAQADSIITQAVKNTQFAQLVLVSKSNTRIGKIYPWIDSLTGIINNNNLKIAVSLSVKNQKEI